MALRRINAALGSKGLKAAEYNKIIIFVAILAVLDDIGDRLAIVFRPNTDPSLGHQTSLSKNGFVFGPTNVGSRLDGLL